MRPAAVFLLSLIGVAWMLPTQDAMARRGRDAGEVVADALKGKVIITAKRAPSRFASPSGFIRFLQSNRKQHLWPDKKNKKEWRFEFMAFFARPLNDIEVTVKFYDVTEGKKFVAGDTFYIPQRGQRIFASNMVLNQPRFEVNRKYLMMVLTSRGVVLSSASFWLRGEKERYSGKVTFTDDEASGKGE